MNTQSSLWNEASQHMPEGVAENYRFWGKDKTVFVESAKGCEFVDCDGKRFVDFRLGYGPIILGYGDERVDSAVIKTIQKGGTLTGFATALDSKVVSRIKSLCPNIDKVRFANSGTEAVMGALRTARGYTGRERIAIAEGGFHGLFDEVMWKSDVENWSPKNTDAPLIVPFGGGIPKQSRQHADWIPLNDFESVDKLFKNVGDNLACVLLEPIIGNCGSISASKEWLSYLRQKCDDNNTLLIFDEVKTGFRVAKGGVQELYGVRADLCTYAKAMGNGYPVAAFGGRADVMNCIGSKPGGVIHGGTYTANLVGLSAAEATLDVLASTDALKTIHNTGERIKSALGRAFAKCGLKHHFAGPASMFGIHLGSVLPNNYREWKKTESSLYERFAWNLIDSGIMLEPDSREPWFVCEAHKDIDFDWLENTAYNSMAKALA